MKPNFWTIKQLNNGQQTDAKKNNHYLYAVMFDSTNHYLCTMVDIRYQLFLINIPIWVYN